MNDWRTPLREALARDDDERLSADEASTMRAAILAEITRETSLAAAYSWMRPIALAATVAGVIAIGIVAGLRTDESTVLERGVPAAVAGSRPGDAQVPAVPGSNRQLQFLTPGGTRIIWVFNSDLDLKATIR